MAIRSGLEFTAWLGLVPRQTGTGGRVGQLGVSKRSSTCLRMLLVHGARSVITRGYPNNPASEPARAASFQCCCSRCFEPIGANHLRRTI